MRLTSSLLLLALSAGAAPVAAQNTNAPGSNWNSSWGFASTAERALGLSQAQTQRAARQPTPNSVTYSTVYNNNTNTNTVGAMNTGDTTVTVTGDSNSLNTTSTADSAGCLDGSVGWTTAETGATGPAQQYQFSVTDGGTATNCTVGN
jgi:hypothetical protein